jgi:hypothetical protein
MNQIYSLYKILLWLVIQGIIYYPSALAYGEPNTDIQIFTVSCILLSILFSSLLIHPTQPTLFLTFFMLSVHFYAMKEYFLAMEILTVISYIGSLFLISVGIYRFFGLACSENERVVLLFVIYNIIIFNLSYFYSNMDKKAKNNDQKRIFFLVYSIILNLLLSCLAFHLVASKFITFRSLYIIEIGKETAQEREKFIA